MWYLRRLPLVLLVLLLAVPGSGAGAQTLARVEAQTPAPGVVRAIMFWMEGCGHCHYVLTEVLPPIQGQYAAQFELRLIEVVSAAEVDAMLAAAEAYGRPKDTVGVPLLLIGDQALMGSQEIPERLPRLIEHYLAQGGVDWPSLAGPVTAAPPAPSGSLAPATAALPVVSGSELAIVVLAGMVLTLIYAAASVFGGARPRVARIPRWLDLAVPVLAVGGLAVAGYLAYVETQAVPAACGPVGDCNTVQSSPYARLFGVLPVGMLGLAGYLAILGAWLWPRLAPGAAARYAPLVVFGLAAVGVLFSLYLTYLEPFVIRAVCLWCLSSAVLITLLLAASLPPALAVLRPTGRARMAH